MKQAKKPIHPVTCEIDDRDSTRRIFANKSPSEACFVYEKFARDRITYVEFVCEKVDIPQLEEVFTVADVHLVSVDSSLFTPNMDLEAMRAIYAEAARSTPLTEYRCSSTSPLLAKNEQGEKIWYYEVKGYRQG